MIDWVHKRLRRWGEWTAGCKRGGGGGGTYPAYQLVHIRGTAGPDPLCTAEEMEMDVVMSDIQSLRPELYDIGRVRYVEDLSNAMIADRMRCHRDTVLSRLNSLHKLVENRLAERSAKRAGTNARNFSAK